VTCNKEHHLKNPAGTNRTKQEKTLDWLAGNSPFPAGEPNPVHPGQKKLQQALEDLQAIARQQQIEKEQDLQNNLSQAAAALQEARRADTLTWLLQEMEKELQNPNAASDPNPLLQLIKELEVQTRQQLEETDTQAARAMQQAVSALAQSQAALFISQSCQQILQLLQQCTIILEKDWPQGKVMH
jgi:hypothetical protein